MDSKVLPPQYQVFINFRGDELRNNFISHLVDALQRNNINIFTDKKEQKGENISNLFKRIEESKIVLAVFSKRYTESRWCLDELVKIKECADLGKLKVLPIFYNVATYDVKLLEGEFGIHFRRLEREYRSEQPKINGWKEALACVSGKIGLTFNDKSLAETDFIGNIVKDVLTLLQTIPSVESTNSPVNKVPESGDTSSKPTKNSQKAQKGNLLSPPPKGKIVPPQDIASGQCRPHITIQVSQASSPASESGLGVQPVQVPYKPVVQPNHGSAFTGVYDGYPISYSDHVSGRRGDSSSKANNSKKPHKPSKRNHEFTGTNGWPSYEF